ncbi:MAG: hypothetical protein SFW35_10265 [Chitinophagales bacterium]|nr:hypothetical protein [Chitinophagales bacterium]
MKKQLNISTLFLVLSLLTVFGWGQFHFLFNFSQYHSSWTIDNACQHNHAIPPSSIHGPSLSKAECNDWCLIQILLGEGAEEDIANDKVLDADYHLVLFIANTANTLSSIETRFIGSSRTTLLPSNFDRWHSVLQVFRL